MKSQIVLLAVSILASYGVSTAARADVAPAAPSVTVHFEDLDTSSASGAAMLYRRLKFAAQSVCHNLEPYSLLIPSRPYTNCVRAALANAVVMVNRPAVTAQAVAHRAIAPDIVVSSR